MKRPDFTDMDVDNATDDELDAAVQAICDYLNSLSFSDVLNELARQYYK